MPSGWVAYTKNGYLDGLCRIKQTEAKNGRQPRLEAIFPLTVAGPMWYNIDERYTCIKVERERAPASLVPTNFHRPPLTAVDGHGEWEGCLQISLTRRNVYPYGIRT